jgi:hypothetical protein
MKGEQPMTTQYDDPRPSLPIAPARLIFGLTLAVAGVLLTADNLGYIDAYPYLRFWPLALVAIGAIKLFDPGSRDLAILLLIMGGWTLLLNLGLIAFTFFDLWPLILIAIGVGFVRRALRRDDAESSPNRIRELAGSSNLALLTTRRVRPGPVFGGGRFAALLGTYQLDLTQSTLESDPTIIEARAFLGAVEIYVPEGWEVIGEVFPVMAGFEMKTGPATEPRRRLVVRGVAMMGGIEVKHIERIGS